MLTPGYDRSMPSTMVSPWWRVCAALGYPELDVVQYPDGEWALIQYYNTPIIPSLTRWNFVLKGIRNTEITPEFIKKYADQLNLEKHTIWEEQEKCERLAKEDVAREERRSEDWATAMLDGVKRNPDLMNRIAKNGLKELDPRKILNHVPRHKLGKGYKSNW